jgi:hypothetical protein
MFLKHVKNSDMVEITDLPSLIDPCAHKVKGRYHSGEEMQDIQTFKKTELVFPSGEELPLCWVDANYKRD